MSYFKSILEKLGLNKRKASHVHAPTKSSPVVNSNIESRANASAVASSYRRDDDNHNIITTMIATQPLWDNSERRCEVDASSEIKDSSPSEHLAPYESSSGDSGYNHSDSGYSHSDSGSSNYDAGSSSCDCGGGGCGD